MSTTPPEASSVSTYRDCLARMMRQLHLECGVYIASSGALVLCGIVLLLAALRMDDRLLTTLLGTGGTLMSSVTVFPLATIFTARRKIIILQQYEVELGKPEPPLEILNAIMHFLEKQLE